MTLDTLTSGDPTVSSALQLNVQSMDLGQVLRLLLPVALRRVNSDTVSIAVVGSASERLLL